MAHEYLTVSALNQYIKQKFEQDPYLHRVYLIGEISNWRKRPGHQYFSLKDSQAVISAVMWKGAFSKIKFQPEEGMKVLVTGRVSTFERSGQYQIYLDSMEPDGVGNLYAAYVQLKRKLEQAGLFAQSHKQPLPAYPKRIAVVTSESGAVIRDIIDAVRKRDPLIQVVLFPAAVQGDQAAATIAKQIERVNQAGTFDTLIIGRGGGSIEDLWPFNEEVVAQAIFASRVPVISSVGHQTDNTIADLVADVRASTPTQAGVLASPVLLDVLAQIRTKRQQLDNLINSVVQLHQQRLEQVKKSYVLQHPERLYEGYVQQRDLLLEKLSQSFQTDFSKRVDSLNQLVNNLRSVSPEPACQMQAEHLDNLQQNLTQGIIRQVERSEVRLNNQQRALHHLSPLKVMQRGYSLVRDQQQRLVKSVKQLEPGAPLQINFSDGTVSAVVKEINSKKVD
ncbi:Exodeoxyribonuclease VII large subunit [Fructilactobacillus florum 8D]|uniref:Exodeoxyribonuclease 7 large subunit n=2 Tax=Fructilactobacillus florum TaxID=640331 RepID=W9EGP7_9LACO|nr:exodeoxyribonuclease VII large subunit [Fructilactobacillus florum]EKK20719.1 Exodeoxyribonuclease VII large subunit [Fructilactobacillus florum 2F]ETO40185.1 Exodeoxyribonuclease VII large subunit [Fructilactobacillus florum 8D]KRM91797.1 Exodeoxyribonuclease 7 large subunit [Fructilactobacillus florum DSM 22689 = JCM 16035]